MLSKMKKIDDNFDEILKVDYELYSLELFELKKLAQSWYKGIDFREFDERRNDKYTDNEKLELVKKTGIACNYFFVYKEGNEYYLLDGFNRLFTEYGKIKSNTPVYLKVITNKLKDYELMSIMVHLNLWKLYGEHRISFNTHEFFDRGFRLLLYKKFGIKIYSYQDYKTRARDNDDFEVLDYYFRNEKHSVGYFKYDYQSVMELFMNPKIVDDLREIIDSNDYLDEKFHQYENYLRSFIMFLSRRRLKGDYSDYKFKEFLEILYKDEKYFKKLQKMSWTDATRKSIFKFVEKIEGDIDG